MSVKQQQQTASDKYSGRFIVFEGGDGAGKSTQLELLAEYLTAKHIPLLCTREPGGTKLGVGLRDLLLHGENLDARTEALLYAADRAHHIASVVKPALAQGKIVLQDRYIDSSIAYQGAGRTLGEEEISNLSSWATAGLTPDLTILVDIDTQTALARRGKRGSQADRIEAENSDFHNSVRQTFLRLAAANPEKYLILDGTKTASELHKQIVKTLNI